MSKVVQQLVTIYGQSYAVLHSRKCAWVKKGFDASTIVQTSETFKEYVYKFRVLYVIMGSVAYLPQSDSKHSHSLVSSVLCPIIGDNLQHYNNM